MEGPEDSLLHSLDVQHCCRYGLGYQAKAFGVIRAQPHQGGLQDVGQLNQEGEDCCRIQGSPMGSESIRFFMGPGFLPFHGVFHAHPRPYLVYLRQDCQRPQLHGVPSPFALGHQRRETFGHPVRPFSCGLHRAQ